jgi:hypothetical protein
MSTKITTRDDQDLFYSSSKRPPVNFAGEHSDMLSALSIFTVCSDEVAEHSRLHHVTLTSSGRSERR